MGTAVGAGILLVLGCYTLYQKLDAIGTTDSWVSPTAKIWLQAGIPATLLLVCSWIIFKILNVPKYADFMIATEGEMKKVSWSTKKEIITSTKVVIITVIILSITLAVIDQAFALLFHKIGVLKVF